MVSLFYGDQLVVRSVEHTQFGTAIPHFCVTMVAPIGDPSVEDLQLVPDGIDLLLSPPRPGRWADPTPVALPGHSVGGIQPHFGAKPETGEAKSR